MNDIKMNLDQIKAVIPHREPMLLVDEVVNMVSERSITAGFYVDPGRDIFRGHFPDEPVLPGVYTVEIMAQTSDILILSCERYAGKKPLFIGINKVKFRAKIKPGDTLEIRAKISYENLEKSIVTCSAEVYDGGVLACEGDVTLAMR